jgi:hypothetical protein
MLCGSGGTSPSPWNFALPFVGCNLCNCQNGRSDAFCDNLPGFAGSHPQITVGPPIDEDKIASPAIGTALAVVTGASATRGQKEQTVNPMLLQLFQGRRGSGPNDVFQTLISWWPVMVAAIGLVALIWWILHWVSRVNEDVDPAEADREMLRTLNDLRREGDLSESEFRSIKGQLVNRLNDGAQRPKPVGKPAKTAESPAEQTPAELADSASPGTHDAQQTTE